MTNKQKSTIMAQATRNTNKAIKRGRELEAKARPPFGGLVELSRLTPKERKEYREICRIYGVYARPRIAK